MKKRAVRAVITAVLLCTLIFSFTQVFFAEDDGGFSAADELPRRAKSYQLFYDRGQLNAAIKYLSSSDEIKEKDRLFIKEHEEQICKRAYKIQYIQDYDFPSANRTKKIFKNYISFTPTWIIPVSEGRSVRVGNFNGKWIFEKTVDKETTQKTKVVMSTLNWHLYDLFVDHSSISLLVCFEVPEYDMQFIYIKTPEEEIFVPYGADEKKTGIKNGFLYSERELAVLLGKDAKASYGADKVSASLGASVIIGIAIVFTFATSMLLVLDMAKVRNEYEDAQEKSGDKDS